MEKNKKNKMKRYLAIGDIHGNLKALEQVLDRCGFDVENDTLIGLGDYVDGHAQSAEVVEFLIGLPNFIGILGNHDAWCREWLNFGTREDLWVSQGGRATIESYVGTGLVADERHREFFNGLHNYYVLELNGKTYAFVHGGYTSREGLGHEDYPDMYYWDRKLWDLGVSKGTLPYVEKRTHMYDTVFIGHTSTFYDFPDASVNPPVKRHNIINLDQGAGWDGYLTVCDVETEECWQSDKSESPKRGLTSDIKFKRGLV